MNSLNNGLNAAELNASRIGLEIDMVADLSEQTEQQELTQPVETTESNPINTAVMVSGCTLLPDVRVLTEAELAEYEKDAEKLLSDAKGALKHANSPDELENHTGVCETAIYLNSWLLYREVQKVEHIKRDIKSGRFPSYKMAWDEYKLSRKKWTIRKDITFDMVERATQESLKKLKSGDWDVEDLPTLYQLNQKIHTDEKSENKTFTVLEAGDAPMFDLPENAKFPVIYGDLVYKINVEIMRNHIAEDAVGFFWLDESQIQKSLDILKNLRFTVKEFAVVDTGKSHNGAFTTRQHRTMVIVCKGDAPKPQNLKMDSVVFDREITKTDKHPLYYAEIIQQMYPTFPVLEIHDESFKYLKQNYLISEAKGDYNGTK